MAHHTKILSVIPARKNSKRLKHKNRLLLNGVSLVGHSIMYAQKEMETDIVVSTDDEEIKTIAEQHGAKVLWRSQDLADDYASSAKVVQDVALKIDGEYDYIALLQPSNPLRPKGLFKSSLKELLKQQGQSLLTVSLNQYKLGRIQNSIFHPITYEIGQRSQDLKPTYFENGLLYLTDFDLAKKGKILCQKPIALIVNHPFSTVDIDTELDFKWAEFILNQYND